MKIKQILEDTFNEMYELVPNHIDTNASFNGNMFETYGEELKYVQEMAKQNRVITIVETDVNDDYNDETGEPVINMVYVSGYKVIDRVGYFVTTEPLTEEFEVILD